MLKGRQFRPCFTGFASRIPVVSLRAGRSTFGGRVFVSSVDLQQPLKRAGNAGGHRAVLRWPRLTPMLHTLGIL
jgi:hypothetical protein